jgi:hypothetical protein
MSPGDSPYSRFIPVSFRPEPGALSCLVIPFGATLGT